MDPGEFRLQNVLRDDEEDAIGKRLPGLRIHPVLSRALEAADWSGSRPGAHRGRGVSIYGRHISGGETGITLTAELDGTLTVLSPTVDQGTGTHTILRQLVAERMQVTLERVRVVTGDTDVAPYDTGARASRVTFTAGQAVEKACDGPGGHAHPSRRPHAGMRPLGGGLRKRRFPAPYREPERLSGTGRGPIPE